MTASSATVTPFSAVLPAETATDHRGAEHSPFMHALMRKTLPLAGYVDLLTQYLHVYRALEDGATALASDPTVAPFLDRALDRVPALEADISGLTARPELAGVTFSATTATETYAARIREVTTGSPAAYVAHHYTRYLGDLSGGFAIGRIVTAAYDLTPTEGGRFAVFEDIADPAEFKTNYRAALDAAPWTESERADLITEVHAAYRFNVEIFQSLDHHGA